MDDVIGKAAVIVWPLDRFGLLDSPDIQAVAASGPVPAPEAVVPAAMVPFVLWRRRRHRRTR